MVVSLVVAAGGGCGADDPIPAESMGSTSGGPASASSGSDTTGAGPEASGTSGTGSGDETSGGSAEEESSTGEMQVGPCFDRGCVIECFDEEAGCDAWVDVPDPWACDLPQLCGTLITDLGHPDYDADVFVQNALCLMEALRDGTPGRIAFDNAVDDEELGFLGAQGSIHVLEDRTVVVDMNGLEYCGTLGTWYPQRSKVMNILPADDPSFATCLAASDFETLRDCAGIPTSAQSSAIELPWMLDTCQGETAACPAG